MSPNRSAWDVTAELVGKILLILVIVPLAFGLIFSAYDVGRFVVREGYENTALVIECVNYGLIEHGGEPMEETPLCPPDEEERPESYVDKFKRFVYYEDHYQVFSCEQVVNRGDPDEVYQESCTFVKSVLNEE